MKRKNRNDKNQSRNLITPFNYSTKTTVIKVSLVILVMVVVAIVSVLVTLATVSNGHHEADFPRKAVAVINTGVVGSVTGYLELSQSDYAAPVIITGEISGLTPNAKHGFHVHAFGDVRKGCGSTGGHFNPQNVNHGAPTDGIRHVGDLGNIESDASGKAIVNIVDAVISLAGPHNIVGRAFVVHAGTDDLGRGGFEDSLKTGHAGDRIGCGIIGTL